MEDIFLNADIRLVQEPQRGSLSIRMSKEQFEKACKDPYFVAMAKSTPYAIANRMLDNIKKSLSEFYVTKPPINRRERRERAREIKREILRFKDYCKKNGIRIENTAE